MTCHDEPSDCSAEQSVDRHVEPDVNHPPFVNREDHRPRGVVFLRIQMCEIRNALATVGAN